MVVRVRKRRRLWSHSQRGFTMLELLIALTVLLVGLTGIIGMQVSSMRATGYSRHATEASVLCEDKLEALRTVPVATIFPDSEQIDAQGIPDPNGLFARAWTIATVADLSTITVSVTWNERGNEPHTITMRTQRIR